MTRSSGRIAAFVIGVALGAGLWALRGGRSKFQTPPEPTDPVVDDRRASPWDPGSLDHLLAVLLQEDASASERLEAAAELSEIPVESIPQALEKVTSTDDYQLSFPAKLLLVRWASVDGEGAARWAWHRASSPNVWEYAFSQIGPAWEWHDARSFGVWVTKTAVFNPRIDSPAKDTSSEQPVVNATLLESAAEWLVRDQPRLAFEAKKRLTFGTDDAKLIAGLADMAQIQEALGAFEPLDAFLPSSDESPPPEGSGQAIPFTDHDELSKRMVMEILQRWKQIDSTSFENSKYVASVPDVPTLAASPMDRFSDLPAEERPVEATRIASVGLPHGFTNRVGFLTTMMDVWIERDPQQCFDWLGSPEEIEGEGDPHAKAGLLSVVFDVWNGRHPGEKPDQSGWPPERIRAWQDLEVLRQAAHR